MKGYNLRNKIDFSGEPDEDGDIRVSARSSTVYMTRKEVRELRDHLDAILSIDPRVGTYVRITKTSHKDLMGGVGLVVAVTPSGNLELSVGNESIIVGPNSVVPF